MLGNNNEKDIAKRMRMDNLFQKNTWFSSKYVFFVK